MNRIAIFSGWHFMRWLRLLVGGYALWQSIEMSDWMLAVAGVFLLVMAVFNIGCCGAGGCSIQASRPIRRAENKAIEYEEVDTGKQP